MSRTRLAHRVNTFRRAQDGTTLVEFAIVLPIFLLLLFALIDFGRMGYEYVLAQKAMQKAARIAVVRPSACDGLAGITALPTTNDSVSPLPVGVTAPKYGTNCSVSANVCKVVATQTCSGNASNATAQEIWTAVSPLLPPNATIARLSFTYAFNSDLGFLGGPYEPMVTVKLQGMNFAFVSPLGALATLASGVNSNLPSTLPFPAMSVSLPAEDLALGVNG
jgi:Flp pilus assembly protein TadG